jgi:hydrogenase maturation protease
MTLVIGVGNAFRRDDGAGLAVAERLRGQAGLEVLTHHGEGTGLMALWRGRPRVVVIDAASSDTPPGTIHHLTAAAIPAGLKFFSSHAFGVAEAVAMSAALGDLPADFRVIAITGGDFSAGEGLTGPVAAAVEAVVAELSAA